MKKIYKSFAFIIIFSFLFSLFSIFAIAKEAETLSLSAKSVCLIEADSRRILYGKNENIRMPMASTTKIMTAIVALESGISLSTEILVPKEAVNIEGSSLYLAEGEKITFESLLYGLLLCSANDAAIAIAILVAGSVDGFVTEMNIKASELGLSNTHFENPHGLYDDNHYTTAFDLANLMAYCMKNDVFALISGCEKKVFPKGDDGTRVMINHNKLLRENMGIISGKTGFTKKSGRCLVSCAQQNQLNLICVTLNAPDDWNDHKKLYDFGFSNYKKVNFDTVSFNIPLISGQKTEITVASEDISLLVPVDYENIEMIIESPRFLFAGLKKGNQIGKVIYRYNGKILASSPLVLLEDVPKIQYTFNLFEWLKNLFTKTKEI